jgi:predicted DNA-binding transcriptional regulator YafY
MAEKFLDAVLPADFYDASLQDLFRIARTVLESHDKREKPNRKRINDYLKRVAIEQRGQALVEHSVPYDALGQISRAIIEGKCIDLRYGGTKRTLHPYGIVLKSPKIYLLAVSDNAFKKRSPADLVPAQYLCSRITEAKVNDRSNRVPENFDAEKFIARGGADVSSHHESGLPANGFKLQLRIIDAKSENLLLDLKEFPLSKKQELTEEEGTDNVLLTANGMRATHQLTEWIVGRLDRVEVLKPVALRNYIAERIAAVHRLYA